MDRKTHGRSAYIKRGCRCDICVSAQRGYYQANREARIEYSKRWAAQNPERVRANRVVFRQKNPEYFKRNSPEKLMRHRGHEQLRRARKLNGSGESVKHEVVFERDNYICQMCSTKCPPDAVWPAKDFPSLDHIIPLCKGGEHTYKNTQCLCISCNMSKGAKLERPA